MSLQRVLKKPDEDALIEKKLLKIVAVNLRNTKKALMQVYLDAKNNLEKFFRQK